MEIFVINMRDSVERWKSISGQLDKLGLSYSRVEAVVGKQVVDLDGIFDARRFEFESYHELRPGEVGCALSHIKIWRAIVERALDGAIVLEDDSVLDGDFLRAHGALKANSFGMDFVNLSPIFADREESFEEFRALRTIVVGSQRIVECEKVPFRMSGYYISRRGCEVFLRSTRNMYYPVDLLPRYTFPYTRQGYLYPSGISLGDFGSEIDNTGVRAFGTRRLTLRNVLYFLFSRRRLRNAAVLFEKVVRRAREVKPTSRT